MNGIERELGQLRERLLDAIARDVRRRRRRRVRFAGAGIAALATAGAVAGGLSAWGPTGVEPAHALEVRVRDGWLELRLTERNIDSRRLTRELRNAGIRGRAMIVPTSPRFAGRWLLVSEGENRSCGPPAARPRRETRRPVVRLRYIEREGRVLRLPVRLVRESTGSFLFVAGRRARASEQPVDLSKGPEQYVRLLCGR